MLRKAYIISHFAFALMLTLFGIRQLSMAIGGTVFLLKQP
jgi:hypothetical protein